MTGHRRGDQGEPALSAASARALLERAGVRPGDVRVSLVHRHNHVWRIRTSGGAYFVKAWTKDWHGIVMAAPGYFGRQGPFGGEWEHGHQSARAYYRAMEIWWRADEEAGADPAPVAATRAYAERMRPRVEAAFVPPRFTHANCHALHFFAARTTGGWAVTGVVDMEVALGGWPLLDVAGIAWDLSHPRFGGYRWWRPWFEGYGEPDIDLFRLALLTTGSGAARRDTTLRRLLANDTWDELLDGP